MFPKTAIEAYFLHLRPQLLEEPVNSEVVVGRVGGGVVELRVSVPMWHHLQAEGSDQEEEEQGGSRPRQCKRIVIELQIEWQILLQIPLHSAQLPLLAYGRVYHWADLAGPVLLLLLLAWKTRPKLALH